MPAAFPIPPAGDSVWRTRGGWLALAAGVFALLWWAAHQQTTVARKPADTSVLIPLVPPPPLPLPEVQPKPEEVEEEVPPQPVDQPQPTPSTPNNAPSNASSSAPAAPGNAVSVDGPAQAGSDAFNIGSGPGGGMVGSGRPGGGGMAGFNRAAYGAYLRGEIQRAIENDREMRRDDLRARARIWIDSSGRVTRAELAGAKAAQFRALLVGRTFRAPDPTLPMPVSIAVEIRSAS